MSKPSRFFSFVLIVAGMFAVAAPAFAQSQILDASRAQGTVGERYDGYAVVRSNEHAVTLAPLVGSVNAERRKVYAARAQKENVPIEQIGRIYATEIFRSAPAGAWFLKDDGQWIRK